MANVSYIYSASTGDHSFDLSTLDNGLLKFSVAGDVATPATAIAATTTDANDYQPGSLSLSNLDVLGQLNLGSLIYGTGESDYWQSLDVGTEASVMYVRKNLDDTLTPAWGPPPLIDNQLFAFTGTNLEWVGGVPSDGDFLGYTTDNGIAWQATPAITWTRVVGTSATLADDHNYVATNVAQTEFNLPGTASLGETYQILAQTAAGWTIQLGSDNQRIRYGNQITTAVTGTLSSTEIGDVVQLSCIDATTPGAEIFMVTSTIGNLLVS